MRLESEKVWAGNEVKKLRLKKEAALELSRIHLDQAVSYLLIYEKFIHVSQCLALQDVSERLKGKGKGGVYSYNSI